MVVGPVAGQLLYLAMVLAGLVLRPRCLPHRTLCPLSPGDSRAAGADASPIRCKAEGPHCARRPSGTLGWGIQAVVLVRSDPPSWLSARRSGCTDRASANAPAFAGSGLEQLRDPLVGDPQDATSVTHRKVSSLD